MAAAAFLSPQALAAPPAGQDAVHHAAVADAANGLSPAQLLSVTRQASEHNPGSVQPSRYTVRSGDSLSAIAGHFYHNTDAWPVLYWANRGQIRWANVIQTGQVLQIPAEPARIPTPPALLGPPASPAPVLVSPAPELAQAAPVQAAPVQADSNYSGGVPGGAFGQCVVARESGGSAQVMNSTGHYGLYQFSASTWDAYGGNPADFGHANVAEQNQVFSNALAQGGQSSWSAYDGC